MQPATEIAAQVRTGRLRAADVVSDALERANASQDQLNAFTLIDSDGAMARARGIDLLVEAGKDPGPLAGVPVGLKDLIDQRRWCCRLNSLLFGSLNLLIDL